MVDVGVDDVVVDDVLEDVVLVDDVVDDVDVVASMSSVTGAAASWSSAQAAATRASATANEIVRGEVAIRRDIDSVKHAGRAVTRWRRPLDRALGRIERARTGSVHSVPMDDSSTTPQGHSGVIKVLTNDTDPDGDSLSILKLGSPANAARSRVSP